MTQLVLKRVCASPRPANGETTNVLCDGAVVGRIMRTPAAPEARPWMWAYGYHRDHTPN